VAIRGHNVKIAVIGHHGMSLNGFGQGCCVCPGV
jgi:hypothetical protein